jgi:DNA-binding NarL/FixJ family response regulator
MVAEWPAPQTLLMAGSAPFRVILVDDFPSLRALLRALLAACDCLVVGEAADGRQALDLVARVPCDLVVMDINMPHMNGLEATAEIRRRHPEVAVVGFTSAQDVTEHEALRAAGAYATFSKTSPDELIDHICGLVPT